MYHLNLITKRCILYTISLILRYKLIMENVMKYYLNESNWVSHMDNPMYLFNCKRTPLIYKLYDINDKLMYIGQTVTGGRRITTHNRDKDWKFSNVKCIEVPAEEQNSIEKYLIKYHQPYNNKRCR